MIAFDRREFINHWESFVRDKTLKELGTELRDPKLNEKIRACAHSLFNMAITISEQKKIDQINWMQVESDKLKWISQYLLTRCNSKQGLKRSGDFLALSNLASCGEVLVGIEWRKNGLLEGYRVKNLDQIFEIIGILQKSHTPSSTKNRLIKEVLYLIGKEDNLESRIISCYLDFIELPNSLFQHKAFHLDIFIKCLNHLAKLFLNGDARLNIKNFTNDYQKMIRCYAKEILKDKELGSYLLRKSSQPNLFRISEKGKKQLAYVSVAISAKDKAGFNNYLYYYNKITNKWHGTTSDATDATMIEKLDNMELNNVYDSLEQLIAKSRILKTPVQADDEHADNFVMNYVVLL